MEEYKVLETVKKDSIILENFDGAAARITLNRPEKRNASNLQMIIDYFSKLEELKPDDSVMAVITTEAGDTAWNAGRDVSALMKKMLDPKGDYSGYTHYNMMLHLSPQKLTHRFEAKLR